MTTLTEPIITSQRAPHQPRHVASLDGLRAIALLLVICHHVGFPGFKLGFVGVDLFFVLSGFLITTLLITEFQSTGRISLARFWGRRCLRLMPAYWLYVGSMTLLLLFTSYPYAPAFGWTRTTFILSLWLYFHNYLPPFTPFTHWQSITGHLWSLAVEEQFYFLWPGVCFLAMRFCKAEIVSWLLVVAVVVRRLFVAHDDVTTMMYRIDTRGFAIILGCAVALSMYRLNLRGSVWFKRPWLLSSLAVLTPLTLATLTFFNDSYLGYFWLFSKWLLPFLVMEFVAITAFLWYGSPNAVTHFLSRQPLVYIGKISYGLYLYHPVAQYLTWEVLLKGIDHWPQIPKYSLRLALFFFLTFTMAAVSYHFFEKFFLRLKNRLR